MKLYWLPIILFSSLHADWTSEVVEKGNRFYEEGKAKTIQLYRENLTDKPLSKEAMKQQRIERVWNNISDELQEGAEYVEALGHAPESAWFRTDKRDIQEDINALFEEIINALIKDDLLVYKNQMEALKKKIAENKNDILTYREKRIGAPVSSTIYTTKSDYDTKITEAKNEIRILENEIRIIKERLRNNFDEIGVHLSSGQIEVLLARVDGDDIIQIALVMETLKHITEEIMQLMKESGEELKQAKKYYGMHQVLLELVVYMQQKYIDKSDTVYLPKIDKIIADSKQMIEDTKRLRNQEEEYGRRAVYAKNIDALELTLKVAKRYREDLLKARNNMIEAQKISLANLKLSKNTYATVSLSADLYTLISESQSMFEEVSKIQVPSIVPFENMQIRQKYLELTDSLQ